MLIKALVSVLILFVADTAQGSTRLGLHVTQEELNVWQARMTDNVNTINGITFQTVYNARIKADADSFVAQSHPGGDGFWAGYTGSGCAPITVDPGTGGTPFGRGNGAWMMRSAFNFLLTGNTTYANPVRTELLAQIAAAGTDFSNTSKWCDSTLNDVAPIIDVVPWLHRLMVSYDYLIAGGYTGFSETEKTNIKNWLVFIASRWSTLQINGGAGKSGPYAGIFSTPQTFSCSGSQCTDLRDLLYVGGPTARLATINVFGNTATIIPTFAMGMGIMTNTQSLIDFAANTFRGFVTLGIWNDGAISDYRRWVDCSPPCAGSMWGHTGGAINSMISIADMLARTGDTSLYTYSATSQVAGEGGSTVSLQTALELWAKLANHTVTYYGGSVASTNVLSWDTLDGFGNQGDFYWDWGSAVANLYYRNSHVKTSVERNVRVGSGANSGDCFDPQMAGCFSGEWAYWADLTYMFGKMDDNPANPYLVSGGGGGGGSGLSGVSTLSGKVIIQ